MITKEVTYKEAFENKSQRLKAKLQQREALLKSAYMTEPRLNTIDQSLSQIGSNLAITALSGNTKKLDVLKKQSQALTAEKNALLKKAGVPEIEYECALCQDTGLIAGKVCDCIKREAAFVMMTELSREMPLGDSKFENFDLKYYSNKTDDNGENPCRRMTSILNLCREYVTNFNPDSSKNLLFMGSAGLGKTHLTLAIVSGIIEKGFLPIYGSAENLFSQIESERFTGEGRGTYEAMLNCDLLVIDDLGAEITTSFTKSVLYSLINTRILTRKPTIINTNLSLKEIEDKYTARVSSRFIGEYEWNKFLGVDIRQQKLIAKQ
jgi:DNA replication protein DnaC